MASFKERYARGMKKLRTDSTVCPENRRLFKEFFDYQEYKLQRQNDLRALDEPCYKTLYLYIARLRIVNRWFGNRPWIKLSREDIQKVYDDVEDGRIRRLDGRPYKNADTYYGRILKGKPFELAGKADLSKEVIQFWKRRVAVVQFVTREDFLKLVSVLTKPQHLLLFWLAWDIGENIGTLLQLQKKDFTRAVDPDTKEPEYLVNLPREKLKRSRQTRTEPTHYPDTVRYCEMVLPQLADEDRVVSIGYRQALKIIHEAGRKTGVKCSPNAARVRWKDIRSGMACHLLSMGWQPHEVNLRLGHTPNANSLNAYINHLAIDRHRSKKKLYDSQIQALQEELREARERERLTRHARAPQDEGEGERIRNENNLLRAELVQTKARVEEIAEMVRTCTGPGFLDKWLA